MQAEPEFFFEKVLHFNGWGKQIDIAHSVRDNRYTVVKSGNGIGKTAAAAAIGLWFLLCFPDSIVLTTAPTARQVEGLLWKEINSMYRPQLGGTATHLKLSIKGEEWVMLGFTARESTEIAQMAARMQGYHAKSGKVLVIFDEAAGVHPAFWKAKDSLLVSEGCRFLAIGNPTSTSGPFYDAFKSPNYNKFTVSCLDHPNIKEQREVIPGAVTQMWIEERKIEWGESSTFWKSYVLGEFPEQGEDNLFKIESVLGSYGKLVPETNKYEVKVISVDVARFGTDRTVITLWQGNVLIRQYVFQGKDTKWTADKMKEIDAEFKCDGFVIDDVGVGGGVTDNLNGYRRESDRFQPQIIPLNVASASQKIYGKIEFINLRAELYWQFAKAFERGEITIDDFENNQVLTNELTAIKYEYTPQQKIKIQSKDDMKKQGLPSPDCADSAALGWWGKNMVTKNIEEDIESDDGNLLGENHYLFKHSFN